jgi:Flp pilus assembly pilin Flp
MRELFVKCLKNEEGTEVLEYALVMGLIVVICIGLMGAFGLRVVARWESMVESI